MMANSFWIEDWFVEVRLGRLSRGSETVHLEPQVMKVLAYLASKPLEVVLKDELLRELWKGGVASDAALARCISRIRVAFGDEARQPRIVQTVPKIGYRLVASVRSRSPVRTSRSRWWWAAAPAACLLFAAFWANQADQRTETDIAPGYDPVAYEAYRKGRELYNKYTYAYNQNAIALFERALEIDPDFGLAHAGLSDALVQEAHYWGGTRIAQALQHAQQAVEFAPQHVESQRALGKAAAINGDEERALAALRRALEIEPGDWASALQSANLYFQRLEFDKAEAHYLVALRHAPNLDIAMSNLGYLYLKAGDVDAARHWFSRALELFPLQQQAAPRLAMLEMFTGYPEQARSRCERLLESYANNYVCLQVRAVSRLIQQDLAGAMQGFSSVLENFPDDRYARLGQAKVMLAQSKQAEAFTLVDGVFAETNDKIVNGATEAYDYWLIAACHTLRGDVTAAYEWFDKAAEAGRRFSLWDESDPLFASLHGDNRFDRYIAATRVSRLAH